MKTKRSEMWENIGKLSTVLLVVLTFFQVREYVSHSGPNLRATVVSVPYILPKHHRAAIADALERRLESIVRQDPSRTNAVLQTRWSETYDEYKIGQTYVEVRLSNNGDRIASEIVLDTPWNGFAEILMPDSNTRDIRYSGSVKLGTLRHGTSALVRLWTDSEVREFTLREMQLTYNEGRVNIRYLQMATGLAAFVQDYGARALMIFILVATIVIMIYARAKPEPSRRQGSEPTSVENLEG